MTSMRHGTMLDAPTATRFARLALACVDREYPNKIAHVLESDEDVLPPRKLTPAFFGCFDWHSAVHGHWLLARLARIFPDEPFAAEARDVLQRHIAPDPMARETKYLSSECRSSFERPYGLAWLLLLGQELREWDDVDARRWASALSILEVAARQSLATWLPKLSHPERTGVHSQTAFALGLMHDSSGHDEPFRLLIEQQIRIFYIDDKDCPVRYEPSGQDFLSPCLGEADVVRRVLGPEQFAEWLDGFLPEIPFQPVTVTDPSDGKLAHLDGLNLSRAWMLEGIAAALPPDHGRRETLLALSAKHRNAGLAAISAEHYEGSHWLGTFAVYLLTRRGLPGGWKPGPI
jgi:hypothetical protein